MKNLFSKLVIAKSVVVSFENSKQRGSQVRKVRTTWFCTEF